MAKNDKNNGLTEYEIAVQEARRKGFIPSDSALAAARADMQAKLANNRRVQPEYDALMDENLKILQDALDRANKIGQPAAQPVAQPAATKTRDNLAAARTQKGAQPAVQPVAKNGENLTLNEKMAAELRRMEAAQAAEEEAKKPKGFFARLKRKLEAWVEEREAQAAQEEERLRQAAAAEKAKQAQAAEKVQQQTGGRVIEIDLHDISFGNLDKERASWGEFGEILNLNQHDLDCIKAFIAKCKWVPAEEVMVPARDENGVLVPCNAITPGRHSYDGKKADSPLLKMSVDGLVGLRRIAEEYPLARSANYVVCMPMRFDGNGRRKYKPIPNVSIGGANFSSVCYETDLLICARYALKDAPMEERERFLKSTKLKFPSPEEDEPWALRDSWDGGELWEDLTFTYGPEFDRAFDFAGVFKASDNLSVKAKCVDSMHDVKDVVKLAQTPGMNQRDLTVIMENLAARDMDGEDVKEILTGFPLLLQWSKNPKCVGEFRQAAGKLYFKCYAENVRHAELQRLRARTEAAIGAVDKTLDEMYKRRR